MSVKEKSASLARFKTPFYFYDLDVLDQTLMSILKESKRYGYKLHFAVKSNANKKILERISSSGMGAECVSGNEILLSLESGFQAEDIVFAGVGKTDDEIIRGIENNIFCFNIESIQEMEVINKLSSERNRTSSMALRINPDIDSFTHEYITTGIQESKFGIGIHELSIAIQSLKSMKNLKLIGLHFHIGSQIRRMDVFKNLCLKINDIQRWLEGQGIITDHINVGGGLGINYEDPDDLPEFDQYFSVFNKNLELRNGQGLHMEPGRCITGQAGSLITRVLYIKKGIKVDFAIVDAGLTDLIRPALYHARHKIENITSDEPSEKYDVVGPVCESSDSFGKHIDLPRSRRGDILAIRSAGAYGEVMSSNYNLRDKAPAIFSSEI